MSPQRFNRCAAETELQRLADWWADIAPDTENGGFAGEIDPLCRPVAGANKGAVLNGRLLWFFSTMAARGQKRHRPLADRAYDYLLEHFDDPEHGGVFWELACDGEPINGKKQTYAICFFIYGLCAYFEASGNRDALRKARAYADTIEQHARDSRHGGYLEAFARDWKPIDDYRLGQGDLNVPKTMNTHLHLLEAYSALHRVAPSADTAGRLTRAIDLLCSRIFDRKTGHLRLYFDVAWNNQATIVSYGHDIEASWLLWEAGQLLDETGPSGELRFVVERLARACLEEGIGAAGQVCDEYNVVTRRRSEDAVWWVQAEALVGFLNAYRLVGDPRYRDTCDGIWRYVCEQLIDRAGGDWHWSPTERPYRAGFWKGPYHTGRAMLESLRLLEAIDEA